ncbi:MAG: Ig-like domain-containing protein [Gemmataceae bacterium]
MDSDGTFVVVWMSYGQDASDNLGVYGQRYSANGVPLGGEFLINTTTAGEQSHPSVAMAPDGRFLVTWSALDQDGSDYGVYGRLFAATGVPQGDEFRVNTTTDGRQGNPVVAADGSGNFTVVWMGGPVGGPGYGTGIYGQRYNSLGQPVGGEFQVDTLGGTYYTPSVAADAAGNILVTWSRQAVGGWDSYARFYSSTGAPQGDEFRIHEGTAGDQWVPAAAATGTGAFTVIWRGEDDSGGGVYGRRFGLSTPLPNQPPVATPAAVSVAEDAAVTIDLRTLGSDPDTPVASLTFTVSGAHGGTAELLADGHTVRFTPCLLGGAGASFTYAVADPDGGSAGATVSVAVTPAVPDGQAVLTDGVLRIGGTAADDVIVVTQFAGTVLVTHLSICGGVVNLSLFPAANVTEVRAWGRAGDDWITLCGLTVPALIHGGAGDDVLTGGSGDDVLLGASGDDTITGGSGNDFLLGGTGVDRLVGSAGNDILSGDDVGCAVSLAAMREASQAWASSRNVAADEVEAVADELFADATGDKLTGSAGADLFFLFGTDGITDFRFGKPQTNKDGDVVVRDGVIVR